MPLTCGSPASTVAESQGELAPGVRRGRELPRTTALSLPPAEATIRSWSAPGCR